jgi:hypothetical protein
LGEATVSWTEQLRYSVEVFDQPHGSLVEVLARVSDLDMARAVYAVACQKHPEKFIVLRLKAQILRRSDEEV